MPEYIKPVPLFSRTSQKMRFKFCGDGDCPDWILVQINTLSRMSSIKMKLLSQVVAESLSGDTPIDYEKAKKLTADAKFDEDEVKASVSALSFLLSNAAKHGVMEATLANELQQLGLPREHSQALCRVFSDRSDALIAEARRRGLRTSRLIDAQVKPHTSDTHYQLSLTYWSAITDSTHTKAFLVAKDSLTLLLSDLKVCSGKLQNLEVLY